MVARKIERIKLHSSGLFRQSRMLYEVLKLTRQGQMTLPLVFGYSHLVVTSFYVSLTS